MSPSTINPTTAIQQIARGVKFADIREIIEVNTDCRDSRREWLSTINGAYLYALASDTSHVTELELLANYVDKLINDYWLSKEETESHSENHLGA